MNKRSAQPWIIDVKTMKLFVSDDVVGTLQKKKLATRPTIAEIGIAKNSKLIPSPKSREPTEDSPIL